MVDMQAVLGEIKRTAYVGAGTFASSFVGGVLSDQLPVGDIGVSGAQMLAGAGAAAYISDQRGAGQMTRGLDVDVNEAGRHAAYGLGGAGFAELAENIQSGSSSQSQSGDMIEVRTRSNASSNGSYSQDQVDPNEEISVDV